MNAPTPVGARVRVQHGTGTVRAYENLHHSGITRSEDAPTCHAYRLMVELDPGHSWPCHSSLYCVWEDEITRLYKPEDMVIEANTIKVEAWQREQTAWVLRTPSGIRITHIPTGVVVEEDGYRSQHKNRDMALATLRAKLLEMKDDFPTEPNPG